MVHMIPSSISLSPWDRNFFFFFDKKDRNFFFVQSLSLTFIVNLVRGGQMSHLAFLFIYLFLLV